MAAAANRACTPTGLPEWEPDVDRSKHSAQRMAANHFTPCRGRGLRASVLPCDIALSQLCSTQSPRRVHAEPTQSPSRSPARTSRGRERVYTVPPRLSSQTTSGSHIVPIRAAVSRRFVLKYPPSHQELERPNRRGIPSHAGATLSEEHKTPRASDRLVSAPLLLLKTRNRHRRRRRSAGQE